MRKVYENRNSYSFKKIEQIYVFAFPERALVSTYFPQILRNISILEQLAKTMVDTEFIDAGYSIYCATTFQLYGMKLS